MPHKRIIDWKFGQVTEGNRFNIQVGLPPGDHYPNAFKCLVRIKDKKTDKAHKPVQGHGECVGNFSPIWIGMKGEGDDVQFKPGHNFRRKQGRIDEANGWRFVQLTELERMG